MFKVIRSSAGAGKTHALVKHYLGLCLRTENVAAYRQVLALTFTNKAAAEMRERVLSYLRKIAANEVSEAALADVMQELTTAKGPTAEEVVKRAEAVLRHMLHHYGDVAISTIDAFTRRVARPFARDLQLDQALRMTTDQDWYRDRAVDSLIAEAGTSAEVTRLLLEACEQLLEDEQKWDPAASLRSLIKELDQENSIEPLRALQRLSIGDAEALRRRLGVEARAARDRIRAAGEEALALLNATGIRSGAWAQGNTFGKFHAKLAAFDGEWLEENATLKKCIESGKWHSSTATDEEAAAIATHAEALTREAQRTGLLLKQEQRGYFLRDAIRRLLPTAIALRELSRCLEQEKQADGVAFFSDLTRRVAEVMRDEPAPWILERVGERYTHFLIDEFQDTSLLQWQCLLPLIDNALGSGGSALVVGDAKQAIYRWRNGEAQLLIRFPQLHGRGDSRPEREREVTIGRNYREGAPLNANHRSAPTIIGFNNALFEAMRSLLPEAWAGAYHGLSQETKKTEEGFVRLRVLPKEVTGQLAREAEESFLLGAVAECTADGFRPGDIAVLVRDGKKGQRFAELLITEGHAVTSPDGARLTSSAGAQLLVELMRFIQFGDAGTAARVVQRIAQHQTPTDITSIDPFTGMGKGDPQRVVRAWLHAHGSPRLRTTLSALINELCAGLAIDPALDAHLLLLLDEAHAFGKEHGPDLQGFLEHWERRGGQRSLQAGADADAIQVMTIHKAKGLQFPVVIVPVTRMAPAGNRANHLWVDARDADPQLEHALVQERQALVAAGVAEAVHEKEARLFDEVNLLYVAFTRPEQRLYALAARRGADAVTKALIDHVDSRLASDELHLGRRLAPWIPKPMEAATFLSPSVQAGRRDLPLRLEAPEAFDINDPDPQRRRGNLVHEALSRTADASALDAAIASMLREGRLEQFEADDMRAGLSELLARAEVAPWFAPGLQVRAEATIIGADGHAYRPDRVLIDGDRARVLDIKTGAPAPGHHEQVKGYARLLRELGYARTEAALLYTREGIIEHVDG